MTSGKAGDWRAQPGRWSQRIVKSRRKGAEQPLRRSKSVERAIEVDVDKLDAIEAANDDDAGYVEADSSREQTIDEAQVILPGGHRIHLRSGRSGFESLQGVRFLSENLAVLVWTMSVITGITYVQWLMPYQTLHFYIVTLN
jgi:hypothetical protein